MILHGKSAGTKLFDAKVSYVAFLEKMAACQLPFFFASIVYLGVGHHHKYFYKLI